MNIVFQISLGLLVVVFLLYAKKLKQCSTLGKEREALQEEINRILEYEYGRAALHALGDQIGIARSLTIRPTKDYEQEESTEYRIAAYELTVATPDTAAKVVRIRFDWLKKPYWPRINVTTFGHSTDYADQPYSFPGSSFALESALRAVRKYMAATRPPAA